MGVKKSKLEGPVEPLNDDQLVYLTQTTGYSKDSILKYYESFIVDCPYGKLPKEQFKKMYRQLYPHGRSDKFCARIFAIFDRNKDNFLDFEEFLRAIKITMSDNVKDKLKCAFEIYDLNGDGKIDKKEMKKILNHIYDMVGEDNKHMRHRSKFADKKVDLIFEKFDLDRDESLSLDEFISGCMRDDYLNQLFKSTFAVNNSTNNLSNADLNNSINIINVSSESLALTSSNSEKMSNFNEDENERPIELLVKDVQNKQVEIEENNVQKENNRQILPLNYFDKIKIFQ